MNTLLAIRISGKEHASTGNLNSEISTILKPITISTNSMASMSLKIGVHTCGKAGSAIYSEGIGYNI